MKLKLVLLFCFSWMLFNEIKAQCISPVNTFPYLEGFETNMGGWFSGGIGDDWSWGSPSKPVINSAGSGTKCWIIGGLSNSSYTNSEASWLQSPCFDLTSLQYPYIEFKVFWEMEQQFDGSSLQYSIDGGTSWSLLGSVTDPIDCLNANWFNFSPITYLAPLTSLRDGWSGNKQSSAGSCRGGNGSNGWVSAKHLMPALAGKSSVIFRFIFGAGTICNNYDGFAIDDIFIGEAAPNVANFTYTCSSNYKVDFADNSALCPAGFSWDFGDPASGTNNISALKNPTHIFSAPGTYTVTLAVNGLGNAPSTITKDITVLGLTLSVLTPADCLTGTGGSASVAIAGSPGPFTYSWNTMPVQNNAIVTGLGPQTYNVIVNAPGACPTTASIAIPLDLSCIGIYFPSAFTPNNDSKNDRFGPLGSLSLLSKYELSIYNRWGERVFYTTDPYEKWNGKVKGLYGDSGVFVWYTSFSLQGKEVQTMKGTIMLIR